MSYVQSTPEIKQYTLQSGFPATGDTTKIYLVTTGTDANKLYRWNGSNYAEVSTVGTLQQVVTAGNTANKDLLINGVIVGAGGASTTSQNTVLGKNAFNNNAASNYNVAIGSNTAKLLSGGDSNVAMGADALSACTASFDNVVIGSLAFSSYISGTGKNVAIGSLCASVDKLNNPITATAFSTYIGYSTKATQNAQEEIIIGSGAEGEGSYSTVIGGLSTTKTFLKGRLNVGITDDYVDNAAALAASLPIGTIYRTGDLLKIVH